MNIAVTPPELSPLEIDPRPCDWCGFTIDQHVMVDDGEGPEFLCQEIEPHAANLVVQWEMADPRDRWKHTGEAPPKASPAPAPMRQHYRTPQATIDAFWFAVGECKPEHLKAWLADHPRDMPYLLKLLESK
ncbi:MAG: hypothetical protein ABSG88_16540 [Bradyrhizobium sp.]